MYALLIELCVNYNIRAYAGNPSFGQIVVSEALPGVTLKPGGWISQKSWLISATGLESEVIIGPACHGQNRVGW